MYFVIYTSYTKPSLSQTELQALPVQARENNKIKLNTGLLPYFDDKFLQLIKGEENEIKKLYETILKDERHKNVVKLKEGPIKNRFFGDRPMAFKALCRQSVFLDWKVTST